MPKPYSQDLRDRVIDAVRKGAMSRRAAARRYEISESVAIKWLERVERDGSRAPVGHGGHRASKLMPHREFLEAARSEKSAEAIVVSAKPSRVAALLSEVSATRRAERRGERNERGSRERKAPEVRATGATDGG